jgi:hypothetical protein
MSQTEGIDLATPDPEASTGSSNPQEAPPPPDTLDQIIARLIHGLAPDEIAIPRLSVAQAQLLDWKQRSELEAKIEQEDYWINIYNQAVVRIEASGSTDTFTLKATKIALAGHITELAALQKKLRGES